MSAAKKKLPPNGGDRKRAAVDISRLSSGRLHPVPDECLGHEEESAYDYGIPEDVRGYDEDESVYRTAEDVHYEYGSVHDKSEPEGAHGNKTPGEEESFAYKAKAASMEVATPGAASMEVISSDLQLKFSTSMELPPWSYLHGATSMELPPWSYLHGDSTQMHVRRVVTEALGVLTGFLHLGSDAVPKGDAEYRS
ncbi:hypothetical protein Bbelb_072290 [Branchiostoma belcheri]|nr:hypothetical protein Bbelb_072290 [Branchiostoma belcheri]